MSASVQRTTTSRGSVIYGHDPIGILTGHFDCGVTTTFSVFMMQPFLRCGPLCKPPMGELRRHDGQARSKASPRSSAIRRSSNVA